MDHGTRAACRSRPVSHTITVNGVVSVSLYRDRHRSAATKITDRASRTRLTCYQLTVNVTVHLVACLLRMLSSILGSSSPYE